MLGARVAAGPYTSDVTVVFRNIARYDRFLSEKSVGLVDRPTPKVVIDNLVFGELDGTNVCVEIIKNENIALAYVQLLGIGDIVFAEVLAVHRYCRENETND